MAPPNSFCNFPPASTRRRSDAQRVNGKQTQRRHRAAEGVDVAEQVQVPALRDRCLLLPVEIGATRTEPRVRLEI